MTPHRVQLSRAAGWRMPENTVKVDRSTVYGNPVIPDCPPGFMPLAECLTKFEVHATTLDLAPLRGKNLACWCSLDAPCHADTLLRLANPVLGLRIISNAGNTYFEGEDYTTPDWQPGRHLVFGKRAHRILNNTRHDGTRIILVCSLPQSIKPAKEVES